MTESDLVKLIYDNIKLPTTRRNDPFIINVSAIYTSCPRGFLLAARHNVLMHSSDELPPAVKMTYAIGVKIEEIIHEALSDYEIKAEPLKLKVKDFLIVGHMDLLIDYEGNKYILEVKSISRDQFNSLVAPIVKHEHQLRTYLYLAKKNRLDVKRGFLVYVAKEYVQHPIKVFEVELTRHFEKQMKKFIDGVKSGDSKRLCPTPNHAKIINCPVIDLCFSEVESWTH